MKLLKDTNPARVLFLDIETVPLSDSFEKLTEDLSRLWEKKSAYFRDEDQSPADVFERAGLYSEFGKIVCISVGFLAGSSNNMKVRLKSFYGDDEKRLLEDFGIMLNNFCSNKEALLCAHNGKDFDYPFIARRMLINGVDLPAILDNAGKKPWEINLLDTMELWKFGEYKHFTSLELISCLLGIPSPKDDIDGSMVAGIYWDEQDINRIVKYCEKDVITLIRVFLRFRDDSSIPDDRVESVTEFL